MSQNEFADGFTGASALERLSPIAQRARVLCGDRHQDGPAGCPTCRSLEIRLQPVSEVVSPMLADAGLTLEGTSDPSLRACAGSGQPFMPNTLSRDGEVAECSVCGTNRYVCDDDNVEPHETPDAVCPVPAQPVCGRRCEHRPCASRCSGRCRLRPMHSGDCACQCRGGGIAQVLIDVLDRATATANAALRHALTKAAAARQQCDCPMDPHHRWNCELTPIWAQTIRDRDTNPWTVIRPNDLAMVDTPPEVTL